MNKRNRWVQSIIGLGLLLLLTVGLVVLVRRAPIPAQTGPAKATPAAVAQGPTQDALPTPLEIIDPTPTPFPTFTPWPTPTRRPGPTATPMPLPTLAKDAAGSLLYAVRTQLGDITEGNIYQVQVDAKGDVSSPATKTSLGWLRSYPAWDQSLAAFVDRTMGGERIYILDPNASEVKLVKESMDRFGFFLGWHPNNQEILYLVDRSAYGGLWRVNTATEERTIVVQQDPLYIKDAAMSPDGQRIVYTQQKDWHTPGELWTVFSDGSDPTLVMTGTTMVGMNWSPDGRQIALFGSEGLCVLRLGDTACKTVAQDANQGYLFKPMWSPDSRYLAYVAHEPNLVPPDMAKQGKERVVQDWDKEAFLGSNIHLVDLVTAENKQLVSIEPSDQIAGNIDPVWSPDGKWVAFAALRGEQGSIRVINIDGTGLHQVAEAPDLIRFPVWTR